MKQVRIQPIGLLLITLLTACAPSIWSKHPRFLSGEVIVYEDSALFRVPIGRSAHPWTWNEPVSRRLSPAEGYVVTRSLQYGWWARVPSQNEIFELGVHQFADYYAATRRDSLSRLLYEAETCICLVEDSEGGTIEASYFHAEFENAVLLARYQANHVVLVLHRSQAVDRVFESRPDSIWVYRSLPFPRVDSLQIPVRYAADSLSR